MKLLVSQQIGQVIFLASEEGIRFPTDGIRVDSPTGSRISRHCATLLNLIVIAEDSLRGLAVLNNFTVVGARIPASLPKLIESVKTVLSNKQFVCFLERYYGRNRDSLRKLRNIFQHKSPPNIDIRVSPLFGLTASIEYEDQTYDVLGICQTALVELTAFVEFFSPKTDSLHQVGPRISRRSGFFNEMECPYIRILNESPPTFGYLIMQNGKWVVKVHDPFSDPINFEREL
ncbi:hypothetical protein QPK87_07205 [Kamptonema cortianum]|nr:hypothetical protein [Geitlerinema splendidum]MDK3156362.1 hypothetical protein [Kamptonema cortianum]